MICTQCRNEAPSLNVLDDETKVCDGCLLVFFTQCDECGEFWDDSYVEFFATKDGRLICEHCREDFDDEDIDLD